LVGFEERLCVVAPVFSGLAMSDQESTRLIEVVRGLADKVRRLREQYRDRHLGEEGTKAALISPLLQALGWDIQNPDEVFYEFRHNPKDNPVDYCLRLMRESRLLIEAKGLGEDLDDWKWRNQVLSYATAAGVQWCVLTDGDEYRIYNASALVPADLKLLCQVKLSDGRDGEAAKVLSLMSRSNMSGPKLNELWERFHADRRVKDTFRELVDTVDRKLVSLIRKRASDLSTKEIAASIRRLDIRIEAPESPTKPPKTTLPPGDGGRVRGGVTLADLIAAGTLTPPLKLFRKYKGTRLEATLLPDGNVEFQGQRYGTCSAAAEAARKSITRKRLNTNGWSFWQYQGADGKTLTLGDARKQFAQSRSKLVGGREEGMPLLRALRTHGQKDQENRPERYDLRKKFWDGLLSHPKAKTTRHANVSPAECGWIAAGSGVRGLPFVYAIKQAEGRVELYIDRGTGKTAENKRMFDWLHKHKNEIEQAFGGELSWQRLDDKQGCRIAHTLTVGGYRSDESKWPQIQDAMIEAMGRLEKALAPHLEKLKTELTS
jgi:hypothetical protein